MNLDIEIKKLNFALDSYPCKMVASYTAKKTDLKNKDYTLELKNSDGDLLLSFGGPEITESDLYEFKKESISLCTHE